MNRRALFGGLIGALALPATAMAAKTTSRCYEQGKNSVRWTVPDNIKRIRVQSWSKDGNEVIDTHFSVKPGQVFQINVAK